MPPANDQIPPPSTAKQPIALELSPALAPLAHALRTHKRSIVLGASGGIDSSAAMLLLAHAQIPTLVVHVHHHLRDDADHDLLAVQRQAQMLALPMTTVHLPAPTPETTENLSSRSRRLRYNALAHIAQRVNADIFTAHHADDVLETFVMRLMRGTNLANALGPRPTMTWNGQTVLRPLLSVWKTELRKLVQQTNFPWIEDSSNASDTYLRNRIRKQMLPFMHTLYDHPKAAKTLGRLSQESLRIAEKPAHIQDLEQHLQPVPAYLLKRLQWPSAHSQWIERTHAMRLSDYNAHNFRDALYRWCKSQGLSPRYDVLTHISFALWEGTPLHRDLEGLQLQVQSQGLILHRAHRSPPAFEGENHAILHRLQHDQWTEIGAFRLRLETPGPFIDIFARPWMPGDRMRSPHSGRWVGVRKRLARDGVPQDVRDRAIVILTPSTIGADQDLPLNPKTALSMQDAPPADAAQETHTKYTSDEPIICGVITEYNQRLEIRVTPTMRGYVVCAPRANDEHS